MPASLNCVSTKVPIFQNMQCCSPIHSFCPIFSLPYLGGIFLMWAYRGVIPPETSGQAIIILLPILHLTNQNLKALSRKKTQRWLVKYSSNLQTGYCDTSLHKHQNSTALEGKWGEVIKVCFRLIMIRNLVHVTINFCQGFLIVHTPNFLVMQGFFMYDFNGRCSQCTGVIK